MLSETETENEGIKQHSNKNIPMKTMNFSQFIFVEIMSCIELYI